MTSITLTDLIDFVSDLYLIQCENIHTEEFAAKKVPKDDKTAKDSKKNRIYVEGLVPFEKDRYENFMRLKRNKSTSVAYYMVRKLFPKKYWFNITLGKKNYEMAEMKEMLDQKQDFEGKKPLVFIWGFKDPLDEPLMGKFSLELGLDRVQALIGKFFKSFKEKIIEKDYFQSIDHIFRLSNKMEYDEVQENKVRERLRKEIYQRNKDEDLYQMKENSFDDIFPEEDETDPILKSTHDEPLMEYDDFLCEKDSFLDDNDNYQNDSNLLENYPFQSNPRKDDEFLKTGKSISSNVWNVNAFL